MLNQPDMAVRRFGEAARPFQRRRHNVFYVEVFAQLQIDTAQLAQFFQTIGQLLIGRAE